MAAVFHGDRHIHAWVISCVYAATGDNSGGSGWRMNRSLPLEEVRKGTFAVGVCGFLCLRQKLEAFSALAEHRLRTGCAWCEIQEVTQPMLLELRDGGINCCYARDVHHHVVKWCGQREQQLSTVHTCHSATGYLPPHTQGTCSSHEDTTEHACTSSQRGSYSPCVLRA